MLWVLKTYDNLYGPFISCVNLCWLVMTYENLWQLRQLMTTCDKFGWLVATFDHLWWLLSTFDHFWWLTTTSDNLRWLLTTWDNFWQLETTSDNFWQLVTTSGNCDNLWQYVKLERLRRYRTNCKIWKSVTDNISVQISLDNKEMDIFKIYTERAVEKCPRWNF